MVNESENVNEFVLCFFPILAYYDTENLDFRTLCVGNRIQLITSWVHLEA